MSKDVRETSHDVFDRMRGLPNFEPPRDKPDPPSDAPQPKASKARPSPGGKLADLNRQLYSIYNDGGRFVAVHIMLHPVPGDEDYSKVVYILAEWEPMNGWNSTRTVTTTTTMKAMVNVVDYIVKSHLAELSESAEAK